MCNKSSGEHGMTQPEQLDPPKPATTIVATFLAVTILAAIAVGLLVFYLLMTPQHACPTPTVHAGVGKALPYLELLPLTGSPPPASREDLAGHVTLLNFWHVVSAMPRRTAPYGQTPAALCRR